LLQPIAGGVLLAAGLVFCVLPGPGLPLVVVGASLLAERSRTMARALDWLEVKLRKLVGWGIAWWQQAPGSAKNALVLVGTLVVAGAGYGAYHFLFGR